MPTSQRVHRLLARHPSLQATFFLFMERLAITQLLCMEGADIGSVWLGPADRAGYQFKKEDRYASNGQPGLANFATSAIKAARLRSGRDCFEAQAPIRLW